MTSTPRGGGREAMIAATVDTLREGREVRVLEIAETAGVSHSLIYRHFPEGGREELIAEAYARIFRGAVAEDLAQLRGFSGSQANLREQLVLLHNTVLAADRAPQRWARLEALSAARTNAYLAERIEATKAELVDALTDQILGTVELSATREQVREFCALVLGIPLGLTAMLPVEIEPDRVAVLSEVWADLVAEWLFARIGNTP